MNRSKSVASILSFALLLCLPIGASAQTNSDCLTCHGDKGLTVKRGGATISLYTDSATLAASRHGPADCIACHTDLAKKDFPHEGKIAPATCVKCHVEEGKQHARSLHGAAVARGSATAPRCADCHGGHDIVASNDPRSPVLPARVAALCGACHSAGDAVHKKRGLRESEAAANFPELIHGALAKKGSVAVATCVSCHTAHDVLPVSDSRSSIARAKLVATCTQCHAKLDQVHSKVIPADRWAAGAIAVPACLTCHAPHKSGRDANGNRANAACLRCHERADIKASADGHSLKVQSNAVAGSVHAKLSCAQCHTSVDPSHEKAAGTRVPAVDCATCHADVAQKYKVSTHGQLEAKKDKNGPTCAECHGGHDILAKKNPVSPTFPLNVPTLCARCHRTGEKAANRYKGKQLEIVERYAESIHGTGLINSGLVVSAVCTSCHTAHSVLPADSLTSSVNRNNIPATCGACHVGIQDLFEQSVHSAKVTATTKPLPVCGDCHSAHTINRTDDAGFKLVIMDRCGKCHEKIAKEYFDSYHGKVSRLGFTQTAQCYDCHGSHEILPARDPRAHLNSANVVATCQKCHPGAGPKFASYITHATPHDRQKYPWLFYAFWGMTALLVGTLGFTGAHSLLWFWHGLKTKGHATAAAVAVTAARAAHKNGKEKEFERFTRLNRVLHIVMIITFIGCAATGMSLKFSNTGWASSISHLLGGFQIAGFIHRFCALLMIALFLTHLVDVARRKKGPWMEYLLGANTMIPTLKDAKEFIATVKYFLGRGERPKYSRWTYWEKFDYMGVFWGMVVIGGTGLALWFPVFFTRFLPGWALNVATIIHSDEALLATGFIFTVHFFNTHLRPEKFPMDTVIFTGRMSVEELKEDKPAEYAALVEKGELEEHLVEPYQPIVIRAFRAFAWTALTAGILIVVWIVYAMLFARG